MNLVAMVVWAVLAASGGAPPRGVPIAPDDLTIVRLAVRSQLRERSRDPGTDRPLCVRLEIVHTWEGDRDTSRREVQLTANILRRLTGDRPNVFDANRCVTLPNHRVHLADAKRTPAYLLDITLIKDEERGAHRYVSIEITQEQCAPLSCGYSETYTATKTKDRWSVEYAVGVID